MERLRGTLVHYPWGTFDRIHDLLGTEPDGRPLAEFWLGSHPLSPSTIEGEALPDVLAAHPELLGDRSVAAFGRQLPFLMKLLSARHALSLQAHPDRAQAEAGFAAEEAAGIDRTDPVRIYKDTWPKPEIMVALEEFHTLSGFRDPHETARLFRELGAGEEVDRLVAPLLARSGVAALQQVFLSVLALAEDDLAVVDAALASAVNHRDDPGELGEFARTALELDQTFPRNPGILAALMLNRIVLSPGQAVYLPAGRMHAHLRGTGVEVMATSDNVLRGGLTSKHIDVEELVSVVDFAWDTPEVLNGDETRPGVFDYPTHCEEFDVVRLEVGPDAPVELPDSVGAQVALVTAGSVRLADRDGRLGLASGESVFLPADHGSVRAEGQGQVFLATTGLS